MAKSAKKACPLTRVALGVGDDPAAQNFCVDCMVCMTQNPYIRLLAQVVPLVVISRRKVPFMTSPRLLRDRRMMSHHYRFALEILGQFCCQEFMIGNVPGNEVDGSKLAIAFSDSNSLKVVHPLSAVPDCGFIVPGRREVCPSSRHQKASVIDDQALVVHDVNMMCSCIAHFDQRPINVPLIILMVAADVDHLTLDRLISPRHPATTHPDVAR
ncbi:hypothetical protein PS619_01999 [Pseudomonas fluorescens]|nr:hypothetical protein PS619_01999 [Pseudomonas fluorescens]